MGEKSTIEWTDATWNPVTGCSKVSPGCAHCYAETLSLRRGWSTQPWLPAHAAANVILHEDRLVLPLKWRTPKRIFVNSMADLFHDLVPDAFIARVFATMAQAERHIFQVLTKRPARMQAWVQAHYPTPLPNVWLGTSVENQRWATERIPLLLATPAWVRFLSCEPLLGPVDLAPWLGTDVLPNARLHWVITGGESGRGFRPCNPAGVRALRDQCRAGGVAFFHKQWGGPTPKSRGRDVDGRTWDELPLPA
jgi:protein gp37